MRPRTTTFPLLFLLALLLAALSPARAQGGAQAIYTDSLQSGWQDYGWAAINYANTGPVHTGGDSISVTPGAYQALYVHHAAFDSTPYAALTFWINGGASGGQTLRVQAELGGQPQAAIALPALAANTWQQVTIPLASLGASAQPSLDGFWIQSTSAGSLPTFYVDDIALTAGSVTVPTSAHLTVNAGQAVRTLDGRVYGLNTAVWDSRLGTASSLALVGQMGTQILRFPGGSTSDGYDWSVGRSDGSSYQWAGTFPLFAGLAQAAGAQAFLTVNYGSGTPEMAAAWVAYANGDPANTQSIGVDAKGRDWKTVGFWAALRAATPLATDDGENLLRAGHAAPYGFRYWEIGNECYGSWENDQHGVAGSGLSGSPQDAYTYAGYAAQFYRKMKAVDPTIKVGAVGIPGEDAWGDGQHAVPNPNENNATHSGWTPVVLATLLSLGVTPDFLVHHRYAQGPGSETDSGLLASSGGPGGWQTDAQNLRRMLTDYAGPAGAGVELDGTEANSVYSSPGKQTTSLVNGLFFADSLAALAQTEFNACVWWDFRNGASPGNNNADSLYGWRPYGDYGVVAGGDRSDTPADTPYPTFYAAKLLTHWARGGDQVVSAASDYNRLSVYAAKQANGGLALLVINKDPANDLTGHIALAGFVPGSTTANVWQYGKPQDLANADLLPGTISNAGVAFDYLFPSYSMTVIALAAPVSPPAAPTGLTASASGTQVTLNWQPVTGATGYAVGRGTAHGGPYTPIGVTTGATTDTDAGLTPGTTYYYVVTAQGGGGVSGDSNEAAAAVPAARLPVYRLYSSAANDHLYVATAAEEAAAQKAGYRLEFVIGYAPPAGAAAATPVYRLYSASGGHFYTQSAAESAAAQRGGYRYDEVAFSAYTAAGPGLVPLYRLYSPPANRHFYTTAQNEHDALVKSGWKDEGVTGYLSAAP